MKKKTKKTKPEIQPAKYLWAVMRAHGWDSISTMGFPLSAPSDGPQRFIPVFETREQAVKWNGSEENITLLST